MTGIIGKLATLVVTAALAAGVVLVVQAGDNRPVTAQPNLAGFVAEPPTRVHDTRSGGRLQPGQVLTVNPQVGSVAAVAVNITLTDSTGRGFAAAWASGGQPNTSVANIAGPGQSIANYVVIPVDSNGRFRVAVSTPMHVIVDKMGYFTTGSAGAPVSPGPGHGVTAQITGYSPLSTITEVSGVATNSSGSEQSVRIDVTCPNQTVETRSMFRIPPGETRGWSVLCGGGGFTSGASIARVVSI